jgi:hypothetical protein
VGNEQGSNPAGPAPSPRPFISIDARLGVLRADLERLDNPSDRLRVRYIDFSNLFNAGVSDSDLERHRQAVSLVINSLSRGGRVIVPSAIDERGLFYRVDLRDYEWDAGTWEAIVDDYPYAVRYDEDSRVLPYDERSAEQIREDTGTLVPYVQADWFLAHALSAPRYYDVLGIDANVLAFTRRLGVDIAQNIRDQQVARAGFNRSGVSLHNRVIERHELPGGAGALWLTYDFADSVDTRNVFAHPLDFEPDQSEGLFTLPNGLQGYFIADGRFGRLDAAASNIVTDPHARDRSVRAGSSCMGGCHLAEGALSAVDEVRGYVVLSAPDGRTIDEALGLYAPGAQLAGLIAQDQERYRSAVADTGYRLGDANAIHALVQRHEEELDIAAVAAVLGIPARTLASSIESSPQVFPAEILPLREPGARIYRETLDAIVAGIAEGVGLGEQLQP